MRRLITLNDYDETSEATSACGGCAHRPHTPLVNFTGKGMPLGLSTPRTRGIGKRADRGLTQLYKQTIGWRNWSRCQLACGELSPHCYLTRFTRQGRVVFVQPLLRRVADLKTECMRKRTCFKKVKRFRLIHSQPFELTRSYQVEGGCCVISRCVRHEMLLVARSPLIYTQGDGYALTYPTGGLRHSLQR